MCYDVMSFNTSQYVSFFRKFISTTVMFGYDKGTNLNAPKKALKIIFNIEKI